MSVKIGHSSIDERGKISGGQSGDQTGKEVCIRDYYTKNWTHVLRPKSAELAEKSAQFCEACCNSPFIGYDQGNRNSLYNTLKLFNFDVSRLTHAVECDCSSFMHTCAIAGGADLSYGTNGLVCSTMPRAFEKSGDYEVITDSEYLNSDALLKRGDILVNIKSHTVMVLGNGVSSDDEILTETEESGGYNFVTIFVAVLLIIAAAVVGVSFILRSE